MIRAFIEEDAWCYWVVSVGALLSFLGFIFACICSCRKNENKNEFLGLDGMVTLNNTENEGFDGIPTTNASRLATQDAIDNGKRASGANRSLPDIPKDKDKRPEDPGESASQDIYEATETIGDHSELYATVQDTGVEEETCEQEMQQTSQQNSSTRETSVHPYSRFASSNSDTVEHPYAQLQNVQKVETSQSNRNNIKPAIDTEKPSTSTSPATGNPVAPPRTRRSSSHNSLLSTDIAPCDIQAANAISGGIQANQELPYITPPLLMLLPQPLQPQPNSPQQHFSGDSQDSKGYTSISVREPLANIIAQTKTICRQNQSIRPLTDPHYATVSDDSDEMYAAIDEQDKIYTSGSETYAQIQPTITEVQRTVQTEQTLYSRAPSRSDEVHPAPQPPSVDSLRHVAHAHSRQASSSSANSSIMNPGSPKPEKRQANSPLPPPPEVMTDMYASIEKRTKPEERTKLTLSNGKSLEDMYAKVMKKKKEGEEQSDAQISLHTAEVVTAPSRKLSLVEINRTSWSSHESTEIQKKELDSTYYSVSNNSIGNTDLEPDIPKIGKIVCDDVDADVSVSASPEASKNKGHGYEALNSDISKKNSLIRTSCDPNYEVLRPQRLIANDTDYRTNNVVSATVSARNSTDLSTTYTIPLKHRQTSNASSEDPGYEKVRLRRRIETDLDTDSEPNYESMPHDSGEPNYASVCRPGDSDTDPNYESVNHGDPNYESVKYMSVARHEEPPYEQVNSFKSDQCLDGYEKVKKHLFNADYERIQRSTEPISNGDTDDEQYVQV
ncbi:uncharacterized protein LOC128877643 isoform X1 [Hylaeus volcanicus]|uniref:uncharacterized protein LOC128877643 isoform X1 n=1 Tax=Hylaeus volcanicus TaxID=313075 RepID=UPI0023B7AB8F|nr:uncharacterized protein LOC128877643 isoform X1 [Hylaeus volcanicus]XP_053981110.1 uncharacterized protein LOC128877643 isoform X1 [Hylaeus volcanicus]XP_053981111.1 uncharacterized protein LOC128877643 isoform X1 [Hylaeus volcanicus]